MRRAWVGFDSTDGDQSPLRKVFDGASLVLRCRDWDTDGRDALEHAAGVSCEDGPTIEVATEIVRFLRRLHAAPEPYALVAHCLAGQFRSGSVAEFARTSLGARELEESQRLQVRTSDGSRLFNMSLLRLMRQAEADELESASVG